MPSLVAEAQQPPVSKKRRISKEDDAEDSKKRGRPRVEKNDASAADRRRTQIRMAQRAYRQRKESTLDELRKQVSDLTGVVTSMGAAFSDCVDRLVSYGLPDPAVHELRVTASRLTALKDASIQAKDVGSSDDDDEVAAVKETTASAPNTLPVVSDALTPRNVSVWLDQNELSRNRQAKGEDYLGMGYSIVLPEGTKSQGFDFASEQLLEPMVGMSPELPNIIDLQNVNRFASPPPLNKEARPPRTYSFQESSLGRRIHRACLESGYLLLLDPTRLPHVYERVFKLPLLGLSRETLIANTKTVLDRDDTQPLELLTPPSYHIGGAGTHYPRKDANGNYVKRKALYNLGNVGPQTLKLLMHADERSLTTDMAVEIAGYEGEWLDPYDVEGYLAEKGIVIDTNSSFTELEITEMPRKNNTVSSSSSSLSRLSTPSLSSSGDEQDPTVISAPISNAPWKPIESDYMKGHENDGEHYLQMTDMGGLGYADANGLWVNFSQPDKTISSPGSNALTRSRKTVIVDTSKFLRGLMTSAVCLGEVPGFRRSHVDQALASACFDLF